MADARRMVIVGAGQAGGRAAEALRDLGWAGQVLLIGAEPLAPYHRPPLSKSVLSGERTVADGALFAPSFFTEKEIELRLATTVAEIRRREREILLGDGTRLGYHSLLLATGAEPKRLGLPGAEAARVCYLRTAGDALALSAGLGPGRHVLVVGGGFIGAEAAASAVARGSRVTLVEPADRLMARGVPRLIAERMAARHRAAGVDLRLATGIASLSAEGGITRVELSDGTHLAVDLVLAGIGVAPRTALAAAAGLRIDNGIATDRRLRTEDPNIYAAGDACAFPHDLFGIRLRLESWKNAEHQGRLAARNMLGHREACLAVPWFWSDQYELTIQVTGLPDLRAESIERHLGEDALLIFHLARDGRIVGASGIGPSDAIGRDIRLAQMMIERRLHPDPGALADPSVRLRAMLTTKAA